MVSRGEESKKAITGMIENRKTEAVYKALSGDYKGAVESLGAGLHTIQDKVAHEGKPLLAHGGEGKNDADPAKLSQAEAESTQFLSDFEAAVIKAVGPEKGATIIQNVKTAGDTSAESERQKSGILETKEKKLDGKNPKSGT